MSVHFLVNDLAKWDGAESETLMLTFFSDERPLRGAAGLCDWRLCGRLSRLIRDGHVSGKRGESLLLPPGRRLPFRRVMLFGLGDSHKFTEEIYRQHVRWIRGVAERAGAADYAIQPPGRATGLIGARRALELWLEEMDKDGRDTRVAIVDTQSGQKDMAEILRNLMRRERAAAAAAEAKAKKEAELRAYGGGAATEPEPEPEPEATKEPEPEPKAEPEGKAKAKARAESVDDAWDE